MSNTITAYFKGRTGVAESVYQYDYGRILVIDGLNLPATFEAHFANTGDDNAITVIGQNNRVAIPNACLTATGIVTVYFYLHSGDNDGETEYVVRFAVIRRAKPEYESTAEERSEFETALQQAIAMLQNPRKVNSPLDRYDQVTYGTNGQLLRTKGNGATEWVDVGLPTDEQTAAAVSAWLDEHPEATTTVQDDSLTEAKYKNGSITKAKLANALRSEIYNNPKCLVCVTKVDNGDSYSLMLSRSYDGINFANLFLLDGVTIPYEHRNAGVNFAYANGYFYVLTSIGYWYSKDLINWSDMESFGSGFSGPYIYEDKLFFTRWDYTQPIVNDVGQSTYVASIGYCPLTFNDDGTLALGAETILLSGSSNSSHIDVVVIEYNGTVYLACKDEIKCTIGLYTLTEDTLVDTGFAHRGIGIEACKLVPASDCLYIYADPVGLQTNYDDTTNVSYDRAIAVRMTAINMGVVNTDALLTAINCSYNYHPAFALINELEAVKAIDSIGYSPIEVLQTYYPKTVTLSNTKSNEVVSVINHPCRVTYIAGNTSNNIAYLRFTKVFENEPAMIRLDASSGTTIHPANGVNGKADLTSTDEIIKMQEVITSPVYNFSNAATIFVPVEQFEFRRKLESLPTNQHILTSLNQRFLKSYTVNFFSILGYDTDITTNGLPSASNFFGEYYRQNAEFGHIKLYRIGASVIEYQASIGNGSMSAWVQTQ